MAEIDLRSDKKPILLSEAGGFLKDMDNRPTRKIIKEIKEGWE